MYYTFFFNIDAVVCQNNGQFQVWELNIRQFIVIVEIKYFLNLNEYYLPIFILSIITLLPFFIEMLQYDWLWSGHMIIKEMFYIPIKLKPELARASMTTSDVNSQWRSNFQQQII
jgi:hypothetical protein